MRKNIEVEVASTSTTWWVTIDGIDYTAVSASDDNTNYEGFEVYRVDDKEVTEEEKEEVKQAVFSYGRENHK